MSVVAASNVSARSPWPAGGALLLALLLVGCGSPSDSGTSDDSKPSSTPTSKVTAHASPSRSTSAPTTLAPLPPPPIASDGMRYSACADGTCEVAVSRPVDIVLDRGTLSVTKVKPDDSLNFELTLANGGQASGTMKGTCGTTATFHQSGGGMSTTTCGASSTPTPPAPESGALKMQLAGWNSDHAAVLRLVSG